MIVSVIIPTYKDWSRLKLCLDALAKQTYPTDQFEVIVVNNDPEETCPFELPAANMKIISESQPGSYSARNKGIELSISTVLAFTDADCIPKTNWLEEGILSLMQSSTLRFIVTGKIELFYKNPRNLSYAECYEKHFGFPHQRIGEKEINALVTANAFIHKVVFTKIGLFEKRLYSGGDFEFSKRALKNNFAIVFCPDSVVRHPARYSIVELINKRRRVFGGKVYQSVFSKGENKILSLFINLAKQCYKSLKEIIYALFARQPDCLAERYKLIAASVLILIFVFLESLNILITNRSRRV